jgi:hypothetical protein
MATKVILITFLNTNWINSSLKGTYSSTLDLFWTWKTKTLTRAKKELISKKMSPAWIMMSATVILLRTGASSKMGPKMFWSWIYISYNFTKISYKNKTVICIKVEAVLHPSGKQCLYINKELPDDTMTLYAVKTPNAFDFKAKKIYLRIADVENCKYDFIKSLIPLCLSLDTK